MESNLSCLSSLKDDVNPLYVQPHYKETYRLAIYALLCGGKDAYEEFLRAEQISPFLSEEEILFILANAELPVVEDDDSSEEKRVADAAGVSTYFPTESDEEVPDLDLGWPEALLEDSDTSISLLFHPPRQNTPTIKEVVRKQIQEARQVVAIAMDVFTDVDIFKEIITATLRGVAVYILLDDSQFKSFLSMSHRVGVNIHDLKNIRVRTVQGQQYQCQSGVKFRGDLEQRFLLVDCRTVLYGTYSYTWSFEKINLSMVLVITGQLVASYDEEFRRLYARSTVPPALSTERSSAHYLRDTVGVHSPNSSQLSLNQIHTRPKVMHGIRGPQDNRINNGAMMTRGLSVQERLHQSHCFDMGNLMRGHSYGGELQKLNSMTRMRMGTKDIGVSPEKMGPKLRASRLSQQHVRHQTRYGADQNLIPFNSETSLHRWKMDTYFNDSDKPLDGSCDVTSPYSSNTGLNEHQTQKIHSRSRDIKSRMDEMRQKRLSLQEFSNFKQSQESLRTVYHTPERPKYLSSQRGQDTRPSAAEYEANVQNGFSLDPANPQNTEPNKREQTMVDGHRSVSHHDVTMPPDRRTTQTYDWHEPLSRTTSAAADLDMKINDPSLKLAHLQPSGLQHPRAMESLTKIPEEKEGSRVNSSDSAFKEGSEEVSKDENGFSKEDSGKSKLPAQTQHQDQVGGNPGSMGKVPSNSGSATPRERKKSTPNEVQNAPKSINTSTGSQHAVETKHSPSEKKHTPPLQRKNSLRMKVYSMLSPDDKKTSKKEEKLQKKASMKSRTSGSNQPVRADHSQAPAAEQTKKKDLSSGLSRSQNSLNGPTEMERNKSPFLRSSQRSSKRKTSPARDQDRGSRSTLDDDSTIIYHTRREKVYSRFEYLLSTESLDKSVRSSTPETDRGSSLSRPDSRSHSPSSSDKLGKFMQRVGNLIGKNK